MKTLKQFLKESRVNFSSFKRKYPEAHKKSVELLNKFGEQSHKIKYEDNPEASDLGNAIAHQRKVYAHMKSKGELPKNHTDELRKALFMANGSGGHITDHYSGSDEELKKEFD